MLFGELPTISCDLAVVKEVLLLYAADLKFINFLYLILSLMLVSTLLPRTLHMSDARAYIIRTSQMKHTNRELY